MLPDLIDLLILVLLAGTLGYAYVLDKRVRALMSALRALQPMVGEFAKAVDRSEQSVEALKTLGEAAGPVEPPLTAPGRTDGEQDDPRPGARFRAKMPPPRGTRSVQGKSELVKTFFEATKEREK